MPPNQARATVNGAGDGAGEPSLLQTSLRQHHGEHMTLGSSFLSVSTNMLVYNARVPNAAHVAVVGFATVKSHVKPCTFTARRTVGSLFALIASVPTLPSPIPYQKKHFFFFPHTFCACGCESPSGGWAGRPTVGGRAGGWPGWGGPSGRQPRAHAAAALPAPRAARQRAGARARNSRRRAGTRQRAVQPTVRPRRPAQPVGGVPARRRPADGRAGAAASQPLRQSGRRPRRHVQVPVTDGRRIEVVANGLPLWHGAQLALDATIVSPVTRSGDPHPRADTQPGWAVDNAARRKRRDTYPELTRARRCRLALEGRCASEPPWGRRRANCIAAPATGAAYGQIQFTRFLHMSRESFV